MNLKIEALATPSLKGKKRKSDYAHYEYLKAQIVNRNLTSEQYMRQMRMAAKLAGI